MLGEHLNNLKKILIKRFSKDLLFFVSFVLLLTSFYIFSIYSIGVVRSETAPPLIITYQGKLLESGTSVTTTKAMYFYIYDDLVAGDLLYTASGTLVAAQHVSTTPNDGVFSIDLGGAGTNSIDPEIFKDNSELYLKIKIGDQDLTPRKRITAAPYALNSYYLMGYSASTTYGDASYIPVSDVNGQFVFQGDPQSTAVSGGSLYINPTAAAANETIFGIADNGTSRFRIDKEGDTFVSGTIFAAGELSVTGTSTLATTTITNLDVDSGTLYVDNTNDRVGFGTSTPSEKLHLYQGNFLQTAGSPTHKGSIVDGGLVQLDSPYDVKVRGKYAYVVSYDSDSLEILDVSDPSNPAHVGSLVDNATTALNGATAIALSGSYAYITSLIDDGLEVVDISNPSNPVHVASIVDPVTDDIVELNGAISIYISGNYAYVAADTDNGLGIVDISDPTNPTYVGGLDDAVCEVAAGLGECALVGAHDVFVSGKYAYVVADIDNGLEIVDISDPTNPTHAGSIIDDGDTRLEGAREIYVSGKYAYITAANNEGAVEILDISDPTNPTHVSALADDASLMMLGIRDITVSGKYAYVASAADHGVQVLDISDPTNPVGVGSITDDAETLLGEPYRIFISGKYLFVTSVSDNGLEILDISGIDSPAANIGNIFSSSINVSESVDIGNNLYVRNGLNVGTGGLNIQGDFGMSNSVTNTLSFSTSTLFNTNLSAGSLGSSAFIFDTANTLTNANLLSIRNNGTTKFVIDESGNVGINSSTPLYALSVVGTSYFSATSTFNSNVFVGASSESITDAGFVLDGDDMYVEDLFGIGDSLFVENNINLDGNIVGAGNLTLDGNASVGGTFVVSGTSTLATTTITNLDVDSGTLYVDNNNNRVGFGTSTPSEKLHLYQGNFLQTAGNPTHKGSIADDDTTDMITPYGLAVRGKYAYVVSYGSHSLEILDISDSTKPTHVGSLVDGGDVKLNGATDIALSGDYAYITSLGDDGIEVVDISNPSSPTHVASITDPSIIDDVELNGALSIFISGKYAYVAADTDNGLGIVDISDPKNPTYVGGLDDAVCEVTAGLGECALGGAYDVYVSGRYAYVTGYDDNGLEIIDVLDPTNPTHVGSIIDDGDTLLQGASGIYVSGRYAYVVSSGAEDGLEIIDVSDPTSPTHVSSLTNAFQYQLNGAFDITVSGDYAYVAAPSDDGVQVIDISSSTNPIGVGAIGDDGTTLLDGARKIEVVGKYAYVISESESGLEILDISGIDSPSASIGNINTSNLNVSENANVGNNLYIGNGLNVGSGGLNIQGDFGMSNSVTNTLSFSTSTLFNTNLSAGSIGSSAFIFDTANTLTDANLLSIRNNGSTKFVIDENGNVGINSSTPLYALSVVGTSYISATSTFGSNVYVGASTESITKDTFTMDGDDMYVHDLLGVGDSLFVENNLYIGTSTLRLNGDVTGGLITMTGGTLTIDSSGALNLNTTNDQAVNTGTGKLTAGGDFEATGNSTLTNVSSTNITASGNLDVDGNSTLGGNIAVTGNGTVGGTLGVTGTSTLATTTITKLTATNVSSTNITASGNLGVDGDTDVGGNLAITGNGVIGGTFGVTGTSTLATTTITSLNVDSGTLYVDNINNRVGINSSTPAYALSLNGDIGLENGNSTNTLYFTSTTLFNSSVGTSESNAFIFNTANTLTDANLLSIRNNGTTRFVIDESGNVGINSSTPLYALSVVGTSYFSTTSIHNGNVFVGASSESITKDTFTMNGDDMYVHDLLGVGDSLFVENNLYVGTSTLRLNGDVTGGLITMSGGSLTIDSSGALNLNTTNNQAINTGTGKLTANGDFEVTGNSTLTNVSSTNFSADGYANVGGGVWCYWHFYFGDYYDYKFKC